MRLKLMKLCVALVSVLCSLFALEIFLRIYLRNDYGVPTHRNWSFRKTWSQRYGHLNAHGHRDHPFSIDKPPNTFRILTIGDSLTYGEGIQQLDLIYTEILEKQLNRSSHGLKYEVLNVSHSGWNVREYLSALTDPGLAYEPDLVMIGFYLNDIEMDQHSRPKSRFVPEPVHGLLSRMSYAYWYLFNAADSVLGSDQRWLDYYLSYTAPDGRHWKQFVTVWQEIMAVCVDARVKPVVIILPQLNWLDDSHPFVPLYSNVERISKTYGAEVLNLFPSVKGQDPQRLHVGVTDGHPSEHAHRIYANQIFEFLRAKRLVPSDDHPADGRDPNTSNEVGRSEGGHVHGSLAKLE